MKQEEYLDNCAKYMKEIRKRWLIFVIFLFLFLILYVVFVVGFLRLRQDISTFIKVVAIIPPVAAFVSYILYAVILIKKQGQKYGIFCSNCGHEPDLYKKKELYENKCSNCGSPLYEYESEDEETPEE
jgi:predicted nucleic acid-binding Zn ribbon protein